MAKLRTSWVCDGCGGVQVRWAGKCPDCGAWDSLKEFRHDAAAAPAVDGGSASWQGLASASPAVPLGQVEPLEAPRFPTGVAELDRVLGGGCVPGSAVLLGGDPGIGKSTLLLQALGHVAALGTPVLYASSEESAHQVKLRAERIDSPSNAERDRLLYLLADTNIARILEQARTIKPAILAIDSIQLVSRHDLDALPGSMSQLRRCCLDAVQFAKSTGTVVIVVGHVTKEGDLAGPKLLEHMVDVVLSFEGDRHLAWRVVRGVKNRFGSTLEIGLFEMTGSGLEQVDEGAIAPDAVARAGCVSFPTLAGSRVLLAEIQSLVVAGILGSAKRKGSGLDANRLAMMIAVLERHGGLRLGDRDIYASVAGGLRIIEPAGDLAVCLAVAGAHLDRTLGRGTAAIGEVALSGEVRPTRQLLQRASEAVRRGCSALLVPASQVGDLASLAGKADIVGVGNVAQAIDQLGAVPSAAVQSSPRASTRRS
jgi:DNA repair protein RadA/Sms